jgi:hypothetical protein
MTNNEDVGKASKEPGFGVTEEDIAEADKQKQETEEGLSKAKQKKEAAKQKKLLKKQAKEKEEAAKRKKEAPKAMTPEETEIYDKKFREEDEIAKEASRIKAEEEKIEEVPEEEKIEETPKELVTSLEKYAGKKISGALKVSKEEHEMTPEEIEKAKKEQEEEDERRRFEEETGRMNDIISSLDPDNPAHLHQYMAYKKIDDLDIAKETLIAEQDKISKEKKADDMILELNPDDPAHVREYMKLRKLRDPLIAKKKLINEIKKIHRKREEVEVPHDIEGIGYEIAIDTEKPLHEMKLCAYLDSSKRVIIQENCVSVEAREY